VDAGWRRPVHPESTRRPAPAASGADTFGHVFRSFTVGRAPATPSGMADVPPALDAVRILVLVVVLTPFPWPSLIWAREPPA
jgi:hypothetical protein